jgi:ferredoxin
MAALARGGHILESAEAHRRAGGLRIAGPWRCRLSRCGEVVGRGGGQAPRYVAANGDEGDPGSFCDRVHMEHDPHRVLAGLAYAGHAVGAERGYVYVRSEYPSALEGLSAAVAEATSAGYLGRNLHDATSCFEVAVVEGAGSYVAGEETALLHSLEGRRGAGRPNVVAACTTPATEGMVVRTDDPAATEAGRGTLELLVSSLPARALDLPPERSELVHACAGSGVAGPLPDDRSADRVDSSHPYVHFDPDLCISCRHCVRMCDEVQGTTR